MTWLTIAQSILDGLGIVTLVWLWRDRERLRKQMSAHQLEQQLNQFEKRALDWERETGQYRRKIDEQFRSLVTICDRANVILNRSRLQLAALPVTLEESELRAVLKGENAPVEPAADTLPTLAEFEQNKPLTRSDVALDLKSVLRDQLS